MTTVPLGVTAAIPVAVEFLPDPSATVRAPGCAAAWTTEATARSKLLAASSWRWRPRPHAPTATMAMTAAIRSAQSNRLVRARSRRVSRTARSSADGNSIGVDAGGLGRPAVVVVVGGAAEPVAGDVAGLG